MQPVNFAQANSKQPFSNIPIMIIEENGVKCIISAWKPSKEDIEAINRGEPILLQVYNQFLPTMLYTVNKDGKPNNI